jgi:hypothetical protein
MSERVTKQQEFVDRFYVKHGPCCAGCDHWRHINSVVGECLLSPPVPSSERAAMLGMESVSRPDASGHIMTKRDHRCGAFVDSFDWRSLPPHYLRMIGWVAPSAIGEE